MGVTQNLDSLGLPGTFGLALSSLSGMGAEYRGRAPGTILNNFSSEYLVLGLTTGIGVDLTDRLSVGASATLGNRLRATRLRRPDRRLGDGERLRIGGARSGPPIK